MFDFAALFSCDRPFLHWLGNAVSLDLVTEINESWPIDKTGWQQERGKFSHKDALLFPSRLPEPAQRLAAYMYSDEVCARLSNLTGLKLLPDPWFLEGAGKPALGGGLHEILPGGLLKMHVDFNKHPSGLVRCMNLLIYLNLQWEQEWGGALELLNRGVHDATSLKKVLPTTGMVVIFETTRESWHGHPYPLTCPTGVTRRSLALYYYTRKARADRETTVYLSKK